MTEEKFRQARIMLAQPEETISLIAKLLGVSRATLYKYFPELTTTGLPADQRPGLPSVAGYDTLLPSHRNARTAAVDEEPGRMSRNE